MVNVGKYNSPMDPMDYKWAYVITTPIFMAENKLGDWGDFTPKNRGAIGPLRK